MKKKKSKVEREGKGKYTIIQISTEKKKCKAERARKSKHNIIQA